MRMRGYLVGLGLTAALMVAGMSAAELEEVARAKSSAVRPQRAPAPKVAASRPAAEAKPAASDAQIAAAASSAKPALPPVWNSRCASATRQSAPDCVMEQSAVLNQTGQVITEISVRLPTGSSQPVMMIRAPVGLFLPAGIGLQIDDRPPLQLTVQTCDLKGCYAGTQISQELLGAMKAGSKLAITFQNLARQNITVGSPGTELEFAL